MKPKNLMKIRVVTPTLVVLKESVLKITAVSMDGSFTLLPRHVDVIAALKPGIIAYTRENGEEAYVAVHEGLLVKQREDVNVSTFNAVQSDDLGEMQQIFDAEMSSLDEVQRKSRSALAMLEGGIVKKFKETLNE